MHLKLQWSKCVLQKRPKYYIQTAVRFLTRTSSSNYMSLINIHYCGSYLPPRILIWINSNLYYLLMLPHWFFRRNLQNISRYIFCKYLTQISLFEEQKQWPPPPKKKISRFFQQKVKKTYCKTCQTYMFMCSSLHLSLCSLVRMNKTNIWKRIVLITS